MIVFMQYFDFHGQKLSVIALGCDHYGETTTKANAIANLDLYLEKGGNILDTARVYGQVKPLGPSSSETLLGFWLQERACRKDVFLITKSCHPLKEDTHHSRITRGNLIADIEESLEELKTDKVDLWFYHRDRPDVPADELVDMANEEVYDKGYSTYLGASNWSTERIEAANKWAKTQGKQGFVMSEIQASLAHCDASWWGDDTIEFLTKESQKWYEENQLPILAFSSQAKGLFSHLVGGDEQQMSEKARKRFLSEENRALVPKVKELCDTHHVSPAVISLAYLTSQKARIVPIVGCSNPKQLEDSLSEPDFRLSQEELDYLTSTVRTTGTTHGTNGAAS